MGGVVFGVLVTRFPGQMIVVIVVTVILFSPHPKPMHQNLQFWQEEQSVNSLMGSSLVPSSPGAEAEDLSLGGLTSQRDIGSLAAAAALPEHKVHKVLRARQALEAGSINGMVQQGSEDQAGASGSSCFLSLLQQLGDIYTGLEKKLASVLTSASTSGVHPRAAHWMDCTSNPRNSPPPLIP